MDFRRLPFNFSTTDALKRQEELQRRFGLPSNKGNMYVDLASPGSLGTRSDLNSASNSPRLQHRVPIFVEGNSEPAKPSMDAQNVDTGRKPHVRVIPIEIEGEDSNKRHRWLSGSSEPIKEKVGSISIPVETMKHPVRNLPPQAEKSARVCNIPIKIEGSELKDVVRPKSPVKAQKIKTPDFAKHASVKMNGCSASKNAKVNTEKEPCKVNQEKESPEQLTLKKIQNVEEKMKGYHAEVEKFSGTSKDKQYRYLDEMLTRCMLELDEIDTLGLDTIRLARKAAVKKVQASIDLLETKIVKEECKQNDLKEPMEVESSDGQTLKDSEVKDGSEDDPVNTETGDANMEMTDTLSEQINKVENISIMETGEDLVKPDDEHEPASSVDNLSNKASSSDEGMNVEAKKSVQISEIETVVDNVATTDMEPLVEEPLSDAKDEIAVDMDMVNSYNESDQKFNEHSSIKISEVENDTDLEIGVSEQNLEMEVTEMSDIPVLSEQTLVSNADKAAAETDELNSEQSSTTIQSNSDSNVSFII